MIEKRLKVIPNNERHTKEKSAFEATTLDRKESLTSKYGYKPSLRSSKNKLKIKKLKVF